MFCTKCGSEIKPGNKFCVRCGAPVYTAKQVSPVSQVSGNAKDAETTQKSRRVERISEPQTSQDQAKDQKKKPGKGGIIFLLILLIVILAVGAGAIGYLVFGNQWRIGKEEETDWEDERDDDEEDTENQVEAIVPETEEITTETENSGLDSMSETEEETGYVKDMNIHRYAFFIDDCSWSEALQKAKEGGGYLVRIESREEYDYILSEIARGGYDEIQFRIGARRNLGDLSYYWVDGNNNLVGEPIQVDTYWCHDEWLDGEPSYKDGETEENCVDMFYYSALNHWVWNDVPDDMINAVPDYSGRIGYIVEYED